MFDFDASKLLIIGVVALIVIGPKDLPRVLRQVGQMVGKLRRMAGEFQGQFMDAMKEADLQDLKNEVNKLKDTASLDVAFDPVRDVKLELTKSVRGGSVPPVVPDAPGASADDPYAGHISGVALPAAAETPALPVGGLAVEQGPVVLEAAEPAHHTPAVSAGAVHAVEPVAPDGDAMDGAVTGRPRRVLVPKRRPPGDRLTRSPTVAAGRGRSLLPPRRDPTR